MRAGVTPPAPQADPVPATQPDPILPDPSGTAKLLTLVLMVIAVVLAFAVGDSGTKAFDPSGKVDADLAFFSGFFLAAQAIERILELIAPFIPFWQIPVHVKVPVVKDDKVAVREDPSGPAELINQKKADRGYVMIAVAVLFGVGASAAMGLYLPEAIGIDVERWLDMIVTGVALSGGTKGLHDLIKALQKAKTPGVTAG